jgi:multicomponent Na+:H+ antiporter subunit A
VVLTVPVVLLGVIVAILGIAPGLAADLAAAAGAPLADTPDPLSLAYHLDTRAPNLMALATWAIGLVTIATARYWIALPLRVAHLGWRFGPERAGTRMLFGLGKLSRQARAYEVQTLQQRVGTIFVAAAILVGVTIVFAPPWPSFRVGRLPNGDWPLVLVLTLAALSGIAATRSGGRLTLVLALSSVGYSISAIFVFIGAPDVALVAVLIETMMTLLLLGVLSLIQRAELELPAVEQAEQRQRARIVGLLAAGFAFVVVWGVLSRPSPDATAAQTYIERAPEAHAADVVTVILADFRGLDTLGEVTVISIALLGALTLFAEGMRRRT